jgi:hypothetical protein
MAMPVRLTHADVAHAFVDRYRENFKAIRTNRNTIEVWVKGADREDFIEDVKRYHLRRVLRTYLDWVFDCWPEPKPLKLRNANFLNCALREIVSLLYAPEGL